MRRDRPFHLVLGTALIAILGASFYLSPSNAAGPEEGTDRICEATQLVLIADASGSKGESTGESADVQERAVPRMMPGGTPAPQIEGGVFDGTRLRVKPGYVLEPKPGGSVLLRPTTGGNGFDLSCRCGGGKGRCDLLFDEGSARCYPPKGGCSGSCEMRGSFVTGSSGLRMQ